MDYLYYKSLALRWFVGVSPDEKNIYIIIFDNVVTNDNGNIVCADGENISCSGRAIVIDSVSMECLNVIGFSISSNMKTKSDVSFDMAMGAVMSVLDKIRYNDQINVSTASVQNILSFDNVMDHGECLDMALAGAENFFIHDDDTHYRSYINIDANTYVNITIIDNSNSPGIGESNTIDCDASVVVLNGYINDNGGVADLVGYNASALNIIGVFDGNGLVVIENISPDLLKIIGAFFDISSVVFTDTTTDLLSMIENDTTNGNVDIKTGRPSILSDFANQTLEQLSDKTLFEMFVIIS